MLEHVLSEELEALIAAKLGHPTHDPHGDPIPDADLVARRGRTECLADARAGRRGDARARLRRRARDAALPRRARDRARHAPARGRQAAVRRPAVRRRRRRDARARRPARRPRCACARREPAARCSRPPARRRPARRCRPSPLRAHARAAAPVARRRSRMLGPAFVAAVAYIDPGNFATNIAGGAKYGYMLLWVIVAANLMAMLVQYLSAKTGIATGKNLPELCREHFPRPSPSGSGCRPRRSPSRPTSPSSSAPRSRSTCSSASPPFVAGLMTAVVAFAILELQTRGYRKFELAIAGFLGDRLPRLHVRPAAGRRRRAASFAAGLIPRFDGTDSILLAVGILGATVMPHVVYLHSALTQPRGSRPRTTARSASCCASSASTSCSRWASPGIINLTMLVVAAQLFHDSGLHRRGLDRGRARRLRPRCSAAAPRWPSRSRCSPPACRARASARSPARS